MSRSALRLAITALGLLAVWQIVVWLTGLPAYVLPPPTRVAMVWLARIDYLAAHALVTVTEIGIGLMLGTALGVASGLAVATFAPARRWLMPILIASQAIPVFALAPILVLWLGYGMASKVAMATLVIYFPVAAAFIDGLRRTEPGWLELAGVMTGGARPWALVWHIRVPAALPALASGLRIAAAVAPIGAVIGEWVGSGAGLGYAMLHANGRMQTDLMFAALLTLMVLSLFIYYAVDALLRWALPWQPDSATATA